MNEGSLEKIEIPKNKKREMPAQEILDFGYEMEELTEEMKRQADEIKEELEDINISGKRRGELEENLKMIYIQFAEKWKEFVNDAKDGCEAKIDIEKN